MRIQLVGVLVLGLSSLATAQTREAEIQQQREAREKALQPETLSGAEKFLRRFQDDRLLQKYERGFGGGFRPLIGGLINGGGFALGLGFRRDDYYNGNLSVNAGAQITTRNFQRLAAGFSLPRLLNDKAFFEVFSVHHNYPGVQFYGLGPDSSRGGRGAYRLEDTALDGTFAVRPIGNSRSPLRFLVGSSLGRLWTNVGPGTLRNVGDVYDIYRPLSSIPGLDQQTYFRRVGGFMQLDYRDDPLGPRNGGNYVFQYSHFDDTKLGRFDFGRTDVDLQQYFGFLNKRRVIALRGKTVLTDPKGRGTLPFYLQPVIGGSDDLRGYRPFRFTGRNSLTLNGEYRWEVFSGMDMALFADAGKVFARRSQLNFHDLESSVGFGFRFNARNVNFIRIDVGFSHEGFQVWFKFNDIFGQRPFGTSTAQPVY
jgi:outer membrane protein assembly factor BamA